MTFWTVEDAGPYKEKSNFLMRRSPFAEIFLKFYKKYESSAFYFYKTMENIKSL